MHLRLDFETTEMMGLIDEAGRDPAVGALVDPENPRRERLPIYAGKSLVGFATPRVDRDGIWRMGALWIRPDYRKRGLGRWVIREFMKGKRGRAFIDDANAASQAAFRSAGFRPSTADRERGGVWWQNFDV